MQNTLNVFSNMYFDYLYFNCYTKITARTVMCHHSTATTVLVY